MANKEVRLTMNDAYDAFVDFLEKYYQKTHIGDIGSLIGDMLLLKDDKPTDPAALEDWNESVSKILDQDQQTYTPEVLVSITLTVDEAYNAMIDFLEGYCYRTSSDEIRVLLNEMALVDHRKTSNPIIWNDWIESVNTILNQNPRIRPRFLLAGELEKYR